MTRLNCFLGRAVDTLTDFVGHGIAAAFLINSVADCIGAISYGKNVVSRNCLGLLYWVSLVSLASASCGEVSDR